MGWSMPEFALTVGIVRQLPPSHAQNITVIATSGTRRTHALKAQPHVTI